MLALDWRSFFASEIQVTTGALHFDDVKGKRDQASVKMDAEWGRHGQGYPQAALSVFGQAHKVSKSVTNLSFT